MRHLAALTWAPPTSGEDKTGDEGPTRQIGARRARLAPATVLAESVAQKGGLSGKELHDRNESASCSYGRVTQKRAGAGVLQICPKS